MLVYNVMMLLYMCYVATCFAALVLSGSHFLRLLNWKFEPEQEYCPASCKEFFMQQSTTVMLMRPGKSEVKAEARYYEIEAERKL